MSNVVSALLNLLMVSAKFIAYFYHLHINVNVTNIQRSNTNDINTLNITWSSIHHIYHQIFQLQWFVLNGLIIKILSILGKFQKRHVQIQIVMKNRTKQQLRISLLLILTKFQYTPPTFWKWRPGRNTGNILSSIAGWLRSQFAE